MQETSSPDLELDPFIAAIGDLARGSSEDVSAYFHVIEKGAVVDGTKTTVRVHWLNTDGNNRPRVNALIERLGQEVLDYCIPRSQILAAWQSFEVNKSSDEIMRLRDEARRYFSSLENSGEGGELLLYFLLEKGLGIPQILCKMPLKTNTEMMINGVDGVHAIARSDGGLAVYWGESKVYSDFSSAASDCFNSIAPFLLDDGGGPLRQDLLLARKNIDAGDAELSLRIAEFFDQTNPAAQKLEARGACLIAFPLDPFGEPYEGEKALTQQAITEVAKWEKSVLQRVTSRKLAAFEIEFFCVPLPSAEGFRKAMRAVLGLGNVES